MDTLNQREWFVVQNKNYVGPYSRSEILNLFEQKQISRQTSIVSVGLKNKLTVEQFFTSPLATINRPIVSVSSQKKRKNARPDLVQFRKIEESLKRSTENKNRSIRLFRAEKPSNLINIRNQIKANLSKTLGLLKTIAINSGKKSLDRSATLITTLITNTKFRAKPSPVLENEKQALPGRLFSVLTQINLRKKTIKTIGLTAILIISLSSFFLYFRFSDSKLEIKRPKGVHAKKFNTFKKKLSRLNKKNVQGWEFIQSKDLKKTWVGTNSRGTYKVELVFTSIPQKILSQNKIVFTSTMYVDKHISELKEINFEQGKKLIPGYYQVDIRVLEKISSFWEKLFIDKVQKKTKFEYKVLLNSESPQIFSKTLKNYFQQESRNQNAFLSDIREKYQTLIVISKDLSSKISDLNKQTGNGDLKNNIKRFTDLYREQFGTFFTRFVVENDQKFKDLTQSSVETKTKIVAHYSWLSRIAKKLGVISADFFGDYRKILSEPKSLEAIVKKYNDIIAVCDRRLKRLSNHSGS